MDILHNYCNISLSVGSYNIDLRTLYVTIRWPTKTVILCMKWNGKVG